MGLIIAAAGALGGVLARTLRPKGRAPVMEEAPPPQVRFVVVPIKGACSGACECDRA